MIAQPVKFQIFVETIIIAAFCGGPLCWYFKWTKIKTFYYSLTNIFDILLLFSHLKKDFF